MNPFKLSRKHSALLSTFGLIAGSAIADPVWTIPAGDGAISITTSGLVQQVSLFQNQPAEPDAPQPIARLFTPAGDANPKSANVTSSSLDLSFTDGSTAQIAMTVEQGFTLFRLTGLDLKSSATNLRLLRIPVPSTAIINRTLNAAFLNNKVIAQMSASPEIVVPGSTTLRQQDKEGCSHSFTRTTDAKSGRYAARFAAQCSDVTGGWSMHGRDVQTTVPLKQIAGLSAWIHGDGNGQHLKFQLIDESGGARDYYVPIDFTGWRHVEMTRAALDITTGDELKGLNLYYNSHPASAEVTCLIDDIQILSDPQADGAFVSIPLEDFEDPQSPWWSDDANVLQLDWDLRFAGVGDALGLIATSEKEFFSTIEAFEKAADILVPYPDAQWNKRAPITKENYLFLTGFSESQIDEALALTQMGGFHQVLILQNSWCESTGHYEINQKNFPDGLPDLVRTVNRFREHGIKVGLHLLGASIDNNDPYLTPVPDPRLYKDAQTTLSNPLDTHTTTIVVHQMPDGFPAQDSGYYGGGTILQIGDELIQYACRTTTTPYTFLGCKRGHLGTRAAAHAPGDTVHHLVRAYGYHMFDMDTSILDEITSNFARVANACDIDMVYFDGAERLQGHHGRYNSRLINAYLSKLNRKDILVQASSFTHFSWHQLARSASADGHGDLKGYLEERAPSFTHFRQMGMPLDIGWYYGYDKMATPDMYEYILGTTLGYDSSFSYQVSPSAAKAHPFTGDILRLIKKYDELRKTGRISEAMRQRLQVAEPLLGKSPDDPSRPLHTRRDYRLTANGQREAFQRVIYGEWQPGDTPSSGTSWQADLTTGPTAIGLQIHALSEQPQQPAANRATADNDATTRGLINPQVKIGGEILGWEGTLVPGQYLTMWPGELPIVRGPDAAASMNPPETLPQTAPAPPLHLELHPGTYPAHFTATTTGTLPYRVRLLFATPEKHLLQNEGE